jgi:spore maturation protein CgeB
MRVLIVDTCYSAFLEAHYRAHPGLAERPYEVQWRALMDTSFGTSDAYSFELGRLGHDAHEVIVDCEPLQAAWAREHELADSTAETILLRQVHEFAPDVIYLQNLHVLSDEAMRALKDRAALVVGQIASEAPADERLRMFDLILTSFPHFVERFRELGVQSEYFRIGFDERVLGRIGETTKQHDVVFAGALNRIRHRRGNSTLARAARSLPLEFWGYDLRGWPPWSTIRRRYNGEAWGLDMYRLLAASRVVLNRHIAEAREYANNMRLYEATGVGSLLVTDAKSNLHELFAPDAEVVTYASADELVEKARHYLAHDDELRAVAAAGQARTLREHTYAVRMRELVPILEGRLG